MFVGELFILTKKLPVSQNNTNIQGSLAPAGNEQFVPPSKPSAQDAAGPNYGLLALIVVVVLVVLALAFLAVHMIVRKRRADLAKVADASDGGAGANGTFSKANGHATEGAYATPALNGAVVKNNGHPNGGDACKHMKKRLADDLEMVEKAKFDHDKIEVFDDEQ